MKIITECSNRRIPNSWEDPGCKGNRNFVASTKKRPQLWLLTSKTVWVGARDEWSCCIYYNQDLTSLKFHWQTMNKTSSLVHPLNTGSCRWLFATLKNHRTKDISQKQAKDFWIATRKGNRKWRHRARALIEKTLSLVGILFQLLGLTHYLPTHSNSSLPSFI